MSWNYRVVSEPSSEVEPRHRQFSIREVYYRNDGSVYAYSAEPDVPGGETFDSLLEDLELMVGALTLPVLTIEGLNEAIAKKQEGDRCLGSDSST
jgi:hypothetical protein